MADTIAYQKAISIVNICPLFSCFCTLAMVDIDENSRKICLHCSFLEHIGPEFCITSPLNDCHKTMFYFKTLVELH